MCHANCVVLVVEDEDLLRHDIAGDLREAGCSVLEAATGRAALNFLPQAGEIDLLITDVQLASGPTGWEVAEAFRASQSELPVIYVSGNPPSRQRQVDLSVFISKPYSSWQLLEAYRDLRSV